MRKKVLVLAISVVAISAGIYLWYGSDLRLKMQLDQLQRGEHHGAAEIIQRALDHEDRAFRMAAASLLVRRSGWVLPEDQPSLMQIVRRLFALTKEDDLQLKLTAMAVIYDCTFWQGAKAILDGEELSRIKAHLRERENSLSGKLLLAAVGDPEELDHKLVRYILDVAKRLHNKDRSDDRHDQHLVRLFIKVAADTRSSVQSALYDVHHPVEYWAPPLLDALESTSLHRRKFAARMLRGYTRRELQKHEKAITKSLRARLDDPEPEVRVHVAVALAEANQESGIRACLEVFKKHSKAMIDTYEGIDRTRSEIEGLPGLVIHQSRSLNGVLHVSITGDYDTKKYTNLQERQELLRKRFARHCYLAETSRLGLLASHSDLDREIEHTLRDCLEQMVELPKGSTTYSALFHFDYVRGRLTTLGALLSYLILENFKSDETITFLQKILGKRGSGLIRTDIAKALAPVLEKPAPAFEETLLSILRDRTSGPGWWRADIAEVLADFMQRKDPALEEILIDMLTDPNCYKDYSADYRTKDSPVIALVSETEPGSRKVPPWGPAREVIKALGTVGGERARQHLLTLTRGDWPPSVKQAASHALSQLQGTEAVPNAGPARNPGASRLHP